MKTTIALLIASLISVIGIVFLYGGGNDAGVIQEAQDSTAKNIQKFDQAPDFTLKDYNGGDVSLTDFIGKKVVVVNSWAVWCPFCKNELVDFVKLQEEFADDIAVVAVDRAEALNKAKGFTDSIGVTGKMVFLLDPTDTFYKSIGGFSMPETIFVDIEKNIRVHKRGPMSFDEMKEKVETIIDSL